MKIALVHSFYGSDIPSGENDVVAAQAATLASANHEVSLFARHTDELRGQFGYRLLAGLRTASGFEMGLLKQLELFRPDVVHVHNLFPNFGSSWMARSPYPIVTTLHNFRTMCAAGTLFREGADCLKCPSGSSANAIVHRCYRRSSLASLPLAIATARPVNTSPQVRDAERIVLLSRRAASVFESFGVSRDKISVIPNFVTKSAVELEQEKSNRWCYVGRLTEEKGVRSMIEAWPRGHRLVVYGDGPLRPFVESRQSRWISYRGFLPKSEVQSALARSEGLIFPSLWAEAGPIVYLEALAAGCPVIALGGNAVSDDIAHAGTGVVINSFDQLATALGEVSNNPDYRRAAKTRHTAEYSERVWESRVVDLYREVLRDYQAQREQS